MRLRRVRQVGHPDYEVTGGIATYKGEDLLDLDPEDRARAGLFMSFQSPVEVPGVSNTDFLRAACNARRKAMGQPELVRRLPRSNCLQILCPRFGAFLKANEHAFEGMVQACH
jgi:Fe-S cluster assembly ATPase SufC